MAFPLALALIGGAASLASGAIQAGAARRAADAQADASIRAAKIQERMGKRQIQAAKDISGQQIDLARDMDRQARSDLAPWRNRGENALHRYAVNITRPFKETEAYQFQRDQGIEAIDRSAASRGMLFSGQTQKDLSRFNQGLASQEYGTYLNRLAGLAEAGQGAAARQAGYTMQTGNSMNNALAGQLGYTNQALGGIGNAKATGQINAGNAYASGQIGVANALSGMFGNLTNVVGQHAMMSNMYG
jgi:hypothetical protein